MNTLTNVTARATRSNKWWAIDVPEIPGLFTQARRLDQVEAMVKDAAKILDYNIESVTVEPVLTQAETEMLMSLTEAKAQANQAQNLASNLMRTTVATLHNEGMTMRDVAQLIGITPQRVSALTRN